MTQLTDTERLAARDALQQWFISQDINPQEASIVMIELIAHCLVDKTTDILTLQDSVEAFKLGLVYTIALEIKSKRKRAQ